jgi:hypothetical protein
MWRSGAPQRRAARGAYALLSDVALLSVPARDIQVAVESVRFLWQEAQAFLLVPTLGSIQAVFPKHWHSREIEGAVPCPSGRRASSPFPHLARFSLQG